MRRHIWRSAIGDEESCEGRGKKNFSFASAAKIAKLANITERWNVWRSFIGLICIPFGRSLLVESVPDVEYHDGSAQKLVRDRSCLMSLSAGHFGGAAALQ